MYIRLTCIVFSILLVNHVQSLCAPLSLIYRTIDGSCNNVIHPRYGATGNYYSVGPEGLEPYPWINSPQVVPLPTYADVDSLPDDGPRGNSRDISNTVNHRHVDAIDPINHSQFSVFFGQFINHDLENNRFVNASARDYFPLVTYMKNSSDFVCLYVDDDNPFRCGPNDTVLTAEARFSEGTVNPDGTFRVINDATSFLDLHIVYGHNDYQNDKLRTHVGGKLIMEDIETNISIPFPRTYVVNNTVPRYATTGLPVNPILSELVDHNRFFTAGDGRVNENLGLMFMHVLFAREHNNICDELMAENPLFRTFPDAFDDLIFRKAREINIAKYQKIVYEEFFKYSYGDYFFNLLGDYNSYNSSVNPATSLGFVTAFRYGHFNIRNYFALDQCGRAIAYGVPQSNQNDKLRSLGMTGSAPDFLHPAPFIGGSGGFDNIARGMINERTYPLNGRSDSLIRTLRIPPGVVDLITLDLQRLRHNQVPNYQRVRKHWHKVDSVTDNVYGLPGCPASLENDENTSDPIECYLAITGTGDLASETAYNLKSVYKKINLIDAIVGVFVEPPVAGSSFGRTAGNLIVDQFRRSRDGDRFFYKSLFAQNILSIGWKGKVEGTTMSTLLRRNLSPGIVVPDNPFRAPDNYRQELIESCQ